MGSEIEITETPNWLNELEAKREKRLKTKLGHELGAGAPCVPCGEKCPGLDLHFWRKICKNCKCSKENHEVPDDDIYGWAQDELLGTKVNRLKKKIVLPGRKEEVELDWAPNGQKETIDKYLKTLPTELLPIKGSQAAHDRKQLLKKQIPIHDIDPTLCHELTDEELKKMQEYIAHIKQSSVGVGHLIQINMGKGVTHVLDKEKAMFLINNVPKGIASSENVLLQGSASSVPLMNLANEFQDLSLTRKTKLSNHEPQSPFDIEDDLQNPQCMSLRDQHYNIICNDQSSSPITKKGNDFDEMNNDNSEINSKLSLNRLYGNSSIKNLVPSAFVPIKSSVPKNEVKRDDFNVSERKELPYPSQFIDDNLKYGRGFTNYNNSPAGVDKHKNPAYFEPIKDIRFSDQAAYDDSRLKNDNVVELSSDKLPLQHLSCKTQVLSEENQKPIKINSIKDLAYSTYEDNSTLISDNFNNLSVKDRINLIKKGELPSFRPKNSSISNCDDLSPIQFNTKDHTVPLDNLHDFKNKPNLISRVPETSMSNNVTEDNLKPSSIPIGRIRDIEYVDPEIHTALYKDNEMFEGSTPNKIIPDFDLLKIPDCHHCKKKFKEDELAIAIPERSEAVYHTECFKCSGCNQILADMFYFYDRESDNVYCGRDYAKIRGIPRCKACDELIFVKEYCLAENSTFHVKHFCCFECDTPLAGRNYVMENDQPVCVPCYELTKANKCYACKEVIHPDQQGLQLKDGVHFHATEDCFSCKICKRSLFGAKLLFRKDCLYCSHDCFNSDV